MDHWASEKKEYLEQRPVIDTLLTAQSQIKLFDGYKDQYQASHQRVKELNSLGAQIKELNYRDVDFITQQLQEVDTKWKELDDLATVKSKWLQDEFEKQTLMEKLRLEFAEKVTALNRWYKDSIQVLADATFGDSLEEVIAYKETLDKNDATIHETSKAKKTDLEEVGKQMDALGVKDNKYTMLTLADMNDREANMEEAIVKYKVPTMFLVSFTVSRKLMPQSFLVKKQWKPRGRSLLPRRRLSKNSSTPRKASLMHLLVM